MLPSVTSVGNKHCTFYIRVIFNSGASLKVRSAIFKIYISIFFKSQNNGYMFLLHSTTIIYKISAQSRNLLLCGSPGSVNSVHKRNPTNQNKGCWSVNSEGSSIVLWLSHVPPCVCFGGGVFGERGEGS